MSSFGRWSAYGSVGQTIRLLFLSTNLLSFLLLIAVLCYGGWLYHHRAEYAELLSPSIYVDVSRIMIFVSLMAMINSIIAVYSILKELRCLIYTFSTASGIIFFMLFIGGLMGLVFRSKLVQTPLHLQMLTSLKELYGLSDMEDVTLAWDSLQKNFKCCGVNGTDDWHVWRTSKWHMHYPEPKLIVPESCCAVEECAKMLSKISNSDTNLTNIMKPLIHTNTCYMLLRTDLLYVVHVAAWLSITSSFVMLIPAFFAGFYAKLIRK